jgi:lambda repressor-like predicted transcriptional regulator
LSRAQPTKTVLQALMKHYGYSCRSLAARCGMSKSNLNDIMRGKFPRVDDAVSIARALDVPIEEIWGSQYWPEAVWQRRRAPKTYKESQTGTSASTDVQESTQ